jgi:hypothetical protein
MIMAYLDQNPQREQPCGDEGNAFHHHFSRARPGQIPISV